MKQYFLQQNTKKFGPLTMEELIQKNPKPEDMVWKAGTENWLLAKDVDELHDYFVQQQNYIRQQQINTPPLSPIDISMGERKAQVKEDIEYCLIVASVQVFLINGYYFLFVNIYNYWDFHDFNAGFNFDTLFPYILSLIPLISAGLFLTLLKNGQKHTDIKVAGNYKSKNYWLFITITWLLIIVSSFILINTNNPIWKVVEFNAGGVGVEPAYADYLKVLEYNEKVFLTQSSFGVLSLSLPVIGLAIYKANRFIHTLQ